MIESIFFDLDGTLFLSTPVLHRAYCRGVQEFNFRRNAPVSAPAESAVLDQVGNPVGEIYSNLFPDISTENQKKLGGLILDNLLAEIRQGGGILIEGVEDTLEKLASEYPLALVTNAQRDYMETVLETYNLGRFFRQICCIQDVEGDSKALIIENMLNRVDVLPERVLMVGDRESDYRAAREAGTKFLGCNFGHGARGELPAEIEKISEFKQILDHPLLEG